MTTPIPAPTKWHWRPEGMRDCRCPICNAPATIRGEHRRVCQRKDGPPKYSILRSCGNRLVERIIEKPRRPRRGYKISTANRPPITSKVHGRIIEAGKLLAQGLTMNQIAAKLGVPLHGLTHCQTRHRELWNTAVKEAQKSAAEIVRAMAGTAELFINQGRLLRLAAEAEQRRHEAFLADANGDMPLTIFVEMVYLPSRVEVTREYASALLFAATRFTAFLGHAVTLNELREADVCRYLTTLRKSLLAACTVNGDRRMLLTLWRAAYDYGYCDRPPRMGLIRRLPEELPVPEAWTPEEVGRIIERAAELAGEIAGISAADWWVSLFLVAYWTACRIGALLIVPAAAYKISEGVLARKQKNHKAQWFPLPASCCEAIDRTCPAGRELLWPYPHDKRHFFRQARRIIESAGVPCPKTGKSLFHRMRRTTLSLCAAVDPAIAQRQAGHSTYALTLRHYIDPKIARGRSAADVLPEPVITKLQPGGDAA